MRCQECGYAGITYAYGSFAGYGRLLGRTSKNELAEFSAWEDDVFQEVSSIVDSVMSQNSTSKAECFQWVLGIVSDPAPSGEPYDFTGVVRCPNCGSLAVQYGPDDPPVIEAIHIPLVTHEAWQVLSKDERQQKIEKALRFYDCLSE